MSEVVCFGRFEIRPAERRLFAGGKPVAVGARGFDLLLALIERRDHVVTKDELLDLVWPGVVVEEANVQVQVSHLRKLLDPRIVAHDSGPRLSLRCCPCARVPAPTAAPAGRRPRHTSARRDTNLPPWIEPLIGREADIAALTRLARRTATGHRARRRRYRQDAARAGGGADVLADQYANGVWWVDLAALSATARSPLRSRRRAACNSAMAMPS